MREITSLNGMVFKAALFLLLGLIAGMQIFLIQPTLRMVLLLVVVVWCFCRLYYFAFYVIQHYVDSSFRFSGLLAFILYLSREYCGGKVTR